jgi:hypothetical protein
MGTIPSSGEGTFAVTIEIEAKAGWNRVYMYDLNSERTRTMTTDLSGVPSDLKWRISGDSPDDNNSGGNLEEVFNGTLADIGVSAPISAEQLISGGFPRWSDFMAAGFELYVNGKKVTNGSTMIQPSDTVRILAPQGFGAGNGEEGGNTGVVGNGGSPDNPGVVAIPSIRVIRLNNRR